MSCNFITDLLIVALLMKLLWETLASNLLPRELFAIAVCGLPFLWGMGGQRTGKVLRTGVSITGLLIFVRLLSFQGHHIFYLALLVLGILLYMWGSLARRILSIVIALIILAVVIYFSTRI